MAYDQNSIAKDLRPLNLARTVPEETRIAPVTTSGRNVEGFYGNPPRDVGSPGSIPVYYPGTVSDAGFVGLGYANLAPGIAGWSPRMPTAVTAPAGVNPPTGYCHNPNVGARIGGNASDQASDEGGDDSVAGKKVKFLCSFGGKIIPRPSDGMLRYVGGQTRIISVRRDVCFNELVQKMVDTCGQNVVIKYQLPEEDLDALVSVSCPDDLENMLDEYEKLVERYSDGSAKLRIFLFSASEIDSCMVRFGDLQDSGQRYMEAVNGILDGGGGGITRKESIASATSTQNSELSGSEPVDSSTHGQGDVNGVSYTAMSSPRGNSATAQEVAPKLVPVDPNPALGIPVVKSGPLQTLPAQSEHELESSLPPSLQQQQMGLDLQQPGAHFTQPAPYFQAYMDPHQEAMNRADYGQLPTQIGFPTQMLGTVGPVYTQPQFHDNSAGVSTHQFIPIQMTMTPSSHVSMRTNMVPSLVQPQQIGQRVFQLPGDQNYSAYQAQVPPTMVGGPYGWHQVSRPEQVVPHQQVMLPEKIPRFEDCHMCQKALPHAHSDSVVQDQRESPVNTTSDLNSVYHSFRMVDNMRAQPINTAVVTKVSGEGVIGQGAGAPPRVLGHVDHDAGMLQSEAAGVPQNVEAHYENQRINLPKIDSSDQAKVAVVGLTGGVHSPYGLYSTPQQLQENIVQQLPVQTQYQVQQGALNIPVNRGLAPVEGLPFQTSDHPVHEPPKEYSGRLPGIAHIEDTLGSGVAYEHLKPIDRKMENLPFCPPEAFVNIEQSKSHVDNPTKEDNVENIHLIAGMESYLDHPFSSPKIGFNANDIKPNEMVPRSSNEVPYLNNFWPVSYEVVQPPRLGNPVSYPHSKTGINHLAPDEVVSYSKPAISGVESAQITERIFPLGEVRDNSSRLQPKMVTGDVEAVPLNGIAPFSLSPSERVGDMQDSSNSLFSNQDPWGLSHDINFPPPRPNKLPTRKEVIAAMDPFGDTRLGNSLESSTGNSGELMTEGHLKDGVYQPSSNLNMDFVPEYAGSSKGSAEELIKQELRAVAEGVAASVLQSSIPSNPNSSLNEAGESLSEGNQGAEAQSSDKEFEDGAKFEEEKTKMPEKINLGFPVSDGIGRLQIIKNSDLEELRELGSGTFGTVYHGKWRGSDVAIKRINDRCFAGKPSEQDRMRDDFWNEAIKLADLHHPNVVAFYGVVLDGPGGSVATVTEYMVNGSLRNALQKNERNLDKRKCLLIAMDVAFGMEYLHGKNIVHFDLKSDNLLVNLRDPHRPICKVGDLGLSKVKCQTLISGGVRGTLPWMAPELLNGSSSLVSEKVDVFSFGIVLWELLTGEEPYADLHYGAIIGGIVSNTLRPPVPESCDQEWRSLMERCWSSETSERPNFTEIASQLRSMSSKIPPKGQTQQSPPSTQPGVQK